MQLGLFSLFSFFLFSVDIFGSVEAVSLVVRGRGAGSAKEIKQKGGNP